MDLNVTIEKFSPNGQGEGQASNRAVFAWNALPGEEVRVEVRRKRRGIFEGVTTDILRPSSDRTQPREEHFLSCGAWQNLEFEEEQRQKVKIAQEVFQPLVSAGFDPDRLSITTDNRQYGYRNKMEFSFTEVKGELSLSFHERYTRRLLPIDGCLLADENISRTAKEILEWLRGQGLKADSLKTLILRSNLAGEVIGGLFLKNKNDTIPVLSLDEIGLTGASPLQQPLKSFANFYSDPQSPTSVATELLQSIGELSLTEVVHGKTLRYGLLSFFQVNVPMFNQALMAMAPFVGEAERLDLYCGVGSIGVCLANGNQKTIFIENNSESVNFIGENATANKIQNYGVVAQPTEKALDEIVSNRVVICDPSRSGLHPKVVRRFIETKPTRIIYLACNVVTQARDISFLSEQYKIVQAQLFNFFPRTPHFESLLVLDRR